MFVGVVVVVKLSTQTARVCERLTGKTARRATGNIAHTHNQTEIATATAVDFRARE